MLKILTVPAETEILRRKSQPILKFDEELAEFLRELGETLKRQKDPAGVGLSAIQVGRASRAFAMFLPREKNNEQKTMSNEEKTKNRKQKTEIVFYVNPEMVEHAAEMTLGEELTVNREQRTENKSIQLPASGGRRPFLEGCLSIPRIYGSVLRYPWVKAKATVIRESDPASLSFGLRPSAFGLEKLASRVFQHELDHLNGILFTDHVLAQGNQLYREEGREMVEMEM